MAHRPQASDNARREGIPSQPSRHLYMGLSGTSARQVPGLPAAVNRTESNFPLVAQHVSLQRDIPEPPSWQGFPSWVPPPLLYMALQQAALVPGAGTILRNPLQLDMNLPSPDALSVSDPAERAQLRRLMGVPDVPPLRQPIIPPQAQNEALGDFTTSQNGSRPPPWAVRLSVPAVPSTQLAAEVMNNNLPHRNSTTAGSVLRPVPQSGLGCVALRLGMSTPHGSPSSVASPATVNAQRRDWGAGSPPQESGHFSYPPRVRELILYTLC